jgi:hypothetical protein
MERRPQINVLSGKEMLSSAKSENYPLFFPVGKKRFPEHPSPFFYGLTLILLRKKPEMCFIPEIFPGLSR